MESWEVEILCWNPFRQQSIHANILWTKIWDCTAVSEQTNTPFSSDSQTPFKKKKTLTTLKYGCSEIEMHLTIAVIQ